MKLFILLTLLVSAAVANEDCSHAGEGNGQAQICVDKKALADADKFGAPLTLKKEISVDTAIKMMAQKKDETILLKAKVDKVCQKKGCWMSLKSESSDVRVTFKDYGFFVPISLVGKTVLTQGKMSEKKLTLAQTKHYVEDEGGDPSKVTEPRSDYQFEAIGVVVLK